MGDHKKFSMDDLSVSTIKKGDVSQSMKTPPFYSFRFILSEKFKRFYLILKGKGNPGTAENIHILFRQYIVVNCIGIADIGGDGNHLIDFISHSQ